MTIHYLMPHVGYVLACSVIIGALALIFTPTRFKGYATVGVASGIGAVLFALNNFSFVESCYHYSQAILAKVTGFEISSTLNEFFVPYGLLIAVGGVGAMCGVLMGQLVVWGVMRRTQSPKRVG
jgi:hypothetical protein